MKNCLKEVNAAIWEKKQVSVVIFNLFMPATKRNKAFVKLEKIDSQAKTVVSSRYEKRKGRMVACSRRGGFLQKTFELEDLRDVLKKALG